MTREEKAAKAAKMLMLFNINDYSEGVLNTWYSGIEKDMQEALHIAIKVLQEQSAYCKECQEATNDMLHKMQEKIRELKDKKSVPFSKQDAIEIIKNRIEKSEVGESVDHDQVIADIISFPSAQPFVLTCDGCRHVGTYDTDFPCSGCIRREKDYYEQER